MNKNIIENPKNCRPHVVLLGAGASCAAFPNGDAGGNKLPTMNNFVKTLNIGNLFDEYEIDASKNFEVIYAAITNKALKEELHNNVYSYFNKMSLPKAVTHYDRLVLSLRDKDIILTFNWDPFLFDAYSRNREICSLPEIFFLHGNVRIGACETCDEFGTKNHRCPVCMKLFSDIPLLYPDTEKNYFDSNKYISKSWDAAKKIFSKAFTLTIFGYGAPDSDVEAGSLLKAAWFNNSSREMEYIEVIDIDKESNIYRKWKTFAPTCHLKVRSNINESWLWNYPRRTCESLLCPMSKGVPVEYFSLLNTTNLRELQNYIKNIAKYE